MLTVQCLLDAAVEEDVPAVVQSLLSMVTAATAPRIAAKLRAECNRVNSGTLCLTFEVSQVVECHCPVV